MQPITLRDQVPDDDPRSLDLSLPFPAHPTSHGPRDERDKARHREERVPDQGSPMV